MVTRRIYLKELEQLNQNVIQMGSLLEQSLDQVVLALKTKDFVLAKKIIQDDDEIDHLEHQIEQECIHIIAKQQPVAGDLRRVTSIMRIIADIERIADHCSDISEYILRLDTTHSFFTVKNIEKMIGTVKEMVTETIDSFITEDEEKAKKIIEQDDKVDQYFEDITEEIIEIMLENSHAIRDSVNYLMIIKYLERMADHATNIAEWILYIETGNLSKSMLRTHIDS